jgi:glycopeptide antibiotics resistance protein
MFFKHNAPAFYWAVIILFLTLSPWIPSLPQGIWNFSGIDLLAHLIVFGIQAFLLTRGFEKQVKYPLYKKFSGSLAMTYTSIFGIFIEILQYYHPTRYFEFFDIIADIVGSIIGYGAFRWINGKLNKN